MQSLRKKQILTVSMIVFCLAVFATILAFSIFLIGNKTNGYYTFGSTRGYVVADELMNHESSPNPLARGQMAYFSAGQDFERDIAKGQIVLFKKMINGETAVATRRIDKVLTKRLPSGIIVTTYEVKADNSAVNLPFELAPSEILGIFTNASSQAGAFFIFLNSFAGFVTLVLLPGILGIVSGVFLIFSYLHNRN